MATRARNKLSAKFVEKKDLKPGRYGDGGSLYLNVTPSRTKNWIAIFTRGNVRREVGLGSVFDVSLERARERASELRKVAADGRDVLEFKRVERSVLNFRQAAELYVAAMRGRWKKPDRIEKRWTQILNMKEVADLNLCPVRDVAIQHVLRAVTPLWQSKPMTGKDLVGMIKRVLSFAGANGHRDPNIANPADWNLSLRYVMPPPKRGGNFAAMPYEHVPAFMQSLRDIDTVYSRCLEFVVLTWARKKEVLGAVWSEIDLNKALWTIDAKRMKGGQVHQIPLTRRALEILRQQHSATGGKGFVFPSAIGHGMPISALLPPLCSKAKTQTLRIWGVRRCICLPPKTSLKRSRMEFLK